MILLHIGATASDETACHSLEDWEALLSAMNAGDHSEVIRLTTTTRPTMVATASLRPIGSDALSEFARQYWARQAAAKPASHAAPVINVIEIGASPEH